MGSYNSWQDFKDRIRQSSVGQKNVVLWSQFLQGHTAKQTHKDRWQDWRCQESFLRGEKFPLNHTFAWPDKFLFKNQRNEFEALGRKPLNAIQLISQDNRRHCIMFVWSLTHKTTNLFLFLFFFCRKDG